MLNLLVYATWTLEPWEPYQKYNCQEDSGKKDIFIGNTSKQTVRGVGQNEKWIRFQIFLNLIKVCYF